MQAELTRTFGVQGELPSEMRLDVFTCKSMGKMAGRAVERQLRAMLCEQDGHKLGADGEIQLDIGVCEVCHQMVTDA